jgi:hypothetical protein
MCPKLQEKNEKFQNGGYFRFGRFKHISRPQCVLEKTIFEKKGSKKQSPKEKKIKEKSKMAATSSLANVTTYLSGYKS